MFLFLGLLDIFHLRTVQTVQAPAYTVEDMLTTGHARLPVVGPLYFTLSTFPRSLF